MQLTKVELLYTGCRLAEGPVWLGDTRSLVWSDIPNDRMLRWDEASGQVSEFRKPSGYANGNTRDRRGRILSCEHGGRRVSRTGYDGRGITLIDRFEGQRLNSPNHIVSKPRRRSWVAHPGFRT